MDKNLSSILLSYTIHLAVIKCWIMHSHFAPSFQNCNQHKPMFSLLSLEQFAPICGVINAAHGGLGFLRLTLWTCQKLIALDIIKPGRVACIGFHIQFFRKAHRTWLHNCPEQVFLQASVNILLGKYLLHERTTPLLNHGILGDSNTTLHVREFFLRGKWIWVGVAPLPKGCILTKSWVLSFVVCFVKQSLVKQTPTNMQISRTFIWNPCTFIFDSFLRNVVHVAVKQWEGRGVQRNKTKETLPVTTEKFLFGRLPLKQPIFVRGGCFILWQSTAIDGETCSGRTSLLKHTLILQAFYEPSGDSCASCFLLKLTVRSNFEFAIFDSVRTQECEVDVSWIPLYRAVVSSRFLACVWQECDEKVNPQKLCTSSSWLIVYLLFGSSGMSLFVHKEQKQTELPKKPRACGYCSLFYCFHCLHRVEKDPERVSQVHNLSCYQSSQFLLAKNIWTHWKCKESTIKCPHLAAQWSLQILSWMIKYELVLLFCVWLSERKIQRLPRFWHQVDGISFLTVVSFSWELVQA